MSRLFSELQIGRLSLSNRIIVSPMCQYSAVDGTAGDWHMMHLGSLSLSGAGLLIIEATAVSPQARITRGDLGLYSDANAAALARVLAAIRSHSPIRMAMQLAHAGRKASCNLPWEGGAQVPPEAPGGWKTVAPSPVPHTPHDDVPLALDEEGMERICGQFAAAARRAGVLGLEGIEIHAAHGYLLHQFLSPIANRRRDEHGGSLENRMRFPLKVFDAVRSACPAHLPVWVRLSATDWVAGGWDIEDAVTFSMALRDHGCAAIDVSSAGVSPLQKIAARPGYQVPFARRIKEAVGLPTIAVGLITTAGQAEAIIADGNADAVALARAMLYNPRWPWHAAAELGATVFAPPQYLRSQPSEFKNLFDAAKGPNAT